MFVHVWKEHRDVKHKRMEKNTANDIFVSAETRILVKRLCRLSVVLPFPCNLKTFIGSAMNTSPHTASETLDSVNFHTLPGLDHYILDNANVDQVPKNVLSLCLHIFSLSFIYLMPQIFRTCCVLRTRKQEKSNADHKAS